MVRRCAAMLRIADALDRSHTDAVEAIRCEIDEAASSRSICFLSIMSSSMTRILNRFGAVESIIDPQPDIPQGPCMLSTSSVARHVLTRWRAKDAGRTIAPHR